MAQQGDDYDRLLKSYTKLEEWPSNLVYRGTYLPALDATRKRLADVSGPLFTTSNAEINLAFRDFAVDGNVTARHKVFNDAELRAHLGDVDVPSNISGQGPCRLTKEDPPCRFIFPSSGHNRYNLLLTKQMFCRVMSYHQVMPDYVDFVAVFGHRERSRDLRFGGFCERTLISHPARAPRVPIAGRSGRQYSMCFNIKAPACKSETDLWTIRHAGIFHNFDVVNGKTLWIMTKGDFDLKELVEAITGPHARLEDVDFSSPENSFRSSLAIILMLAHWSADNWRGYLERHEDTIEEKTSNAVQISRKPSAHGLPFDADVVQALHGWQDRMNEAAVVMELNASVLTKIRKYYTALIENKDFPLDKSQCSISLQDFTAQLDDIVQQLDFHSARAKLLVRIISDRKELVNQHLQTQATVTMEGLTKSMHAIGVLGQTEAIAMRIITAVTLLYLPATFVSTFFSTDIVKYQNGNGGGGGSSSSSSDATSFSSVALERWFEVTAPLTVVTILVAVFFFRRSLRSRTDLLSLPFHKTSEKP